MAAEKKEVEFFDVIQEMSTSKKLELQGVKLKWSQVFPEFKAPAGATVTVARMHNPEYNRLLTEVCERRQADLDSATTPGDKDRISNEIMAEVEAATILLGWEGLGADGKPLEYSKAAAVKFLMVPDFRGGVLAQALRMQNFLLKNEKKALGN